MQGRQQEVAGRPAWVVGEPGGRAVIVLHELFGLTDDIRRIAGVFAANGYFAVAPDLFAERGPAPLCVVRVLRDLAKGGAQSLEHIEAVRAWIVDQGVADGAIGVSGFCLGGGFTVLAAGRGGFAVAAPFYGDVPKSERKVARLCPTVGSFGGRDIAFRDGADRLRDHCVRLGVDHDVVLYPEAGHSFMSESHPWWSRPVRGLPPLRVGFDREVAEDAWRRVFAFFDAHLPAASALSAAGESP